MGISEILRRLDAYPRTLDDFSVRSISGAAVTVLSGSAIIILVLIELGFYMTPYTMEQLYVDTTREHKLRINIDITLHNLSCKIVSLDAMDSSGDHHLAIEHDIFKHRLDLHGKPLEETIPIKEIVAVSPTTKNLTCGSCYGAQTNSTQCCNTCDEVLEAYRVRQWSVPVDKIEQCKDRSKESDDDAFQEGCRIQGHLEVHRMAGSFHLAPGKSFSIKNFHIHDFKHRSIRVPHTINHLSFGDKIEFAKTHPLDGFRSETNSKLPGEVHHYYIKIVPTVYMKLGATAPIYTNQFSVTRHRKELTPDGNGVPGIFFSYELSPLMVKYEEKYSTFGHFATNCCSIIGGVFTVAGIFAVFINSSWEMIQKKLEIGKLN